MAEWEKHREVLNRLYKVEDRSLKDVMAMMENEYSFIASKSQYTTQFKKWAWSKNGKKENWSYVSTKVAHRKELGQESAVYIKGVRIDPAIVKKGTSRNVHPNKKYICNVLTLEAPPSQNPGNIIVCAPHLNESCFESLNFHAITSKKRPIEGSFVESSSTKRPKANIKGALISTSNNQLISPKTAWQLHGFWQNKFHAEGKADLADLPYLQFQKIMDSQDVKTIFEQILTLDNSLGVNIIGRFWPQPYRETPGYTLCHSLDTFSSDLYMNNEGEIDLFFDCSQPKPFGVDLYMNDQRDILECQQRTEVHISRLLANMPHTDEGKVEELRNLLLGPPTIDAARRFIEFGVYISSNNLGDTDQLIEAMLESIAWDILLPILLLRVPTIKAFAERVFRYVVTTARLQSVRDMLHHQPFETLVKSDGHMLILAVDISNGELVKILLDAGADANRKGYFGRLPLCRAQTVDVARVLVEDGVADVNGLGCQEFLSDSRQMTGPAFIKAARRGDYDLVTYLIEAGADVTLNGSVELSCGDGKRKAGTTTALMQAIDSANAEVVRLLLQKGALPNFIESSYYFCHTCEERYCPFAGTTAIQTAAAMCNVKLVRLLAKHNGDVNAPASGKHSKTALQAAVSKGNTEMVRLLLDLGADVNAPGHSGIQSPKSVLASAVELKNAKIVQLLIEKGADIDISLDGYPRSFAKELANSVPPTSKLHGLLLARGAQCDKRLEDLYQQDLLRRAVLAGDIIGARNILQSGIEIDTTPYKSSATLSSGYKRCEIHSILPDAIRDRKNEHGALFNLLFDHIDWKKGLDFHAMLVAAVSSDRTNVLVTLLDAGADINSTHCISNCLQECDSCGATPLMHAVYVGSIEVVRFLLGRGANVNAVVKSFRGSSTALQLTFLVNQYTPSQSFAIFHLLIQHGATVNAPIAAVGGRSELAAAVELGNIAIVQQLLQLGANVNSPPAVYHRKTALQAAAGSYYPDLDIIKTLLNCGADVNAPAAIRGGETALGGAAVAGNFQVALLLLEAGADINLVSGHGTPLEHAAYWGRLDMVYMLLKAGADMHLPEQQRFVKAANLARSSGHVVVAEMLENWTGEEGSGTSWDTTISQSKEKGRFEELN